uniref:Peptidase S74 domain-containing protein n=1 Tax=Cyanothece sp. (strain PCC 7425 / ATCC 29141) TaxID=395961 RepID=B8HUU5_CYAP4
MNMWQRLLVVAGVSATPFAVGAIVWALTVPDKGTTSTFGRTLAISNTNTSTSATNGIFNTGVFGAAAKYGLHGLSIAPSGNGNGVGVFGLTKNGLGRGVMGQTTDGIGIYGVNSSSSAAYDLNTGRGSGVFGTGVVGVFGKSNQATGGTGVLGISDSGYGIYGISKTSNSTAIRGENTEGIGVYGQSSSSFGVYGQSGFGFGVYGQSTGNVGVNGVSNSGTGVRAYSNSGTGLFAKGDGSEVAVFFSGRTGLSCTFSGGADWSCSSDRALKENFRSVSSVQILKQLAAMPLQQWQIKGAKQKEYHLGPTAQDFEKAFGFGVEDMKVPEDKGIKGAKGIKNPNAGKTFKGINRADVVGVALVSIQGLYKLTQGQRAELEQKLLAQQQQKDAEIAQIRQQIEQKDQQVAQLEQRVASLQSQLDTRLAALEQQIGSGQVNPALAKASLPQQR